jgi:hypothetical protein
MGPDPINANLEVSTSQSDKQKSNQNSKKATRHGRTITPKEHRQENNLALLADVGSLR